MPVSLVQRGPFSYDEYTNISSSDASTRTFTLTNAKFDSTIGEVLEVFVNGVKLVGDGTFTTGQANPGTGASLHEFSVNSAGTQLTIVSDSDLSTASNSAVTTVASGNTILIRRVSNRTSKKVDFAPGSVIREADLDNANTQVFHVAQEAMDTALQAMTLGADSKWNGESGGVNRVIKNVADPSDLQDVATKNYADQYHSKGLDYRDTSESYAVKINGYVQTFSGGNASTGASGTASDTSDYSSKEWAVGTHSGNTDGSSKQWALGGGSFASGTAVSGSDYSAKEYAVGTTVSTGSAKQWATKDTTAVDTLYSAKEYASGDATASGGSAKAWATDTSSPDGSGEKSAKTLAAEAAASASTAESTSIVMGIALG